MTALSLFRPSSDQLVQLIRTIAQALTLAIVGWLTSNLGVEIESEMLNSNFVYPVALGLWVYVVSWLEQNVHPAFGFLSVIRKSPKYAPEEE